jgi:hypothetical protein
MSRIIDFINFSKNEGVKDYKLNEKWTDYKIKKTFEERQKESQTILNKYLRLLDGRLIYILINKPSILIHFIY